MIMLVECHAIQQRVPGTIILRRNFDIERSDRVHCRNSLFRRRLPFDHCECSEDGEADESDSDMIPHHHNPGMPSPPSIPPTVDYICASTFRPASFTTAS